MQVESKEIRFRVKSGEINASVITPGSFHEKIAVVLPGAAYSCGHPLLYYSIKVLLNQKYKVIAVNKLYGEDPQWRGLSKIEDALTVVEEDSIDFFEQISNRFLRVDVVLARSLGTYALACALEKRTVTPRNIIWQCPSLNSKWNTLKNCNVKGLGIIGTLDERYPLAEPFLPEERLVIEGADHALEIQDNPTKTIEILRQVTQRTHEWLELESQIDTSLTDHTLSLSHEQRIENHESALELVTELQTAGKTLYEPQPKSSS